MTRSGKWGIVPLIAVMAIALPGAAQRPTGQNTPGRRPPMGGSQGGGGLEWSGEVDDTVELLIQNRSVRAHIVSGKKLEREQARFRSSLPRQSRRIRLVKQSGRGSARIFQQPAASNGYTLGVRIEDRAAGRAPYRLRITW
jgi:hypothetical protein